MIKLKYKVVKLKQKNRKVFAKLIYIFLNIKNYLRIKNL
jgi:hypothetical protein